ncbi:hypothetical protein BXZ70DRAFT_1013113 [Cristinia sonorae]|uniref:Uncharacterized protein n=1 Tax=Cristinia sonorae TaxID=1940300 RepID=A0A8K0UCN9_9AGAR|nr:hypothetical protein BXZ70DRAFT_1013113 [Cristinia sonorae]
MLLCPSSWPTHYWATASSSSSSLSRIGPERNTDYSLSDVEMDATPGHGLFSLDMNVNERGCSVARMTWTGPVNATGREQQLRSLTGVSDRISISPPSLASLPKNGVQTNTMSDAENERYLELLLADKYDPEYPVVDFVKAVWGFDFTDIPTRRGGYSLPRLACAEYQEGAYKVRRDGKSQKTKGKSLPKALERDAYQPFMDIMDHLTKQVRQAFKLCEDDERVKLVNMKDHFMGGDNVKARPDLLWTWKDDKGAVKQTWGMTGLAGEMQKEEMKVTQIDLKIHKERLRVRSAQESSIYL